MNMTERDAEILSYLAFAREAGVEWLGSLFFATNPQRGSVNSRPGFAALIRLRKLKEAGLVIVERGRVRNSARGAAQVGCSTVRRVDDRLVAHHDATLVAVEHCRRRLPSGTVVCDVWIEATERGRRMNRRGVKPGAIGSLPDATLNLRDAAGQARTLALEFVTDSYTKAMILEKRDVFRAAYDDVVFYADSPATAQRVALVTGETCQCA